MCKHDSITPEVLNAAIDGLLDSDRDRHGWEASGVPGCYVLRAVRAGLTPARFLAIPSEAHLTAVEARRVPAPAGALDLVAQYRTEVALGTHADATVTAATLHALLTGTLWDTLAAETCGAAQSLSDGPAAIADAALIAQALEVALA